MLKIDGHDDAIVGQTLLWRDGKRVDVYVYSGALILAKLMERDGMTDEEALEFMDFNIEGAYMGLGTPVIMWEQQ
jgi:hypothetical protein